MAETTLTISPTSYTFTSLEESTSINVNTNASSVDFTRVNSLGTGSAVFDNNGRILTSKSYGKGLYKFTATATGGTQKTVYFNLHVARPLLGVQNNHKIFVDSTGTATWEITPPEGYRLKLLDFQDLNQPIVNIEYNNNNTVTFVPITVGDVVCDIVVEKISPAANERNIEYVIGTVTIDVFNLVITPNNKYIDTKINKTITINTIKCILGSSNTGARLTFDVEESTPGMVTVTPNERNSATDGYSYSLNIRTTLKGEARISVLHQDQSISEFILNVKDVKTLTFTPTTRDLKLNYNATHTITGIQFDNNDVKDTVEIVNSNNNIIQTTLTRTNNTNNTYSLAIKNIAKAGGNAKVTLKSTTTTEGQVVFNVLCYKQVVAGQVTTSPSTTNVHLYEGSTYTFEYISLTNTDSVTVESSDVSIAEARLEDLTTRPTKPVGDDHIPIDFPAGSIQKKLHIIGKVPGTCNVVVKGLVNDKDTTVTYNIKVNVLHTDELQDFARLVNLETDKISRSRQGDIIINLPDESSVLVLKEKLQQNVIIEFGYSYDYVDTVNPTKTTNPVLQSNTTGKAIWLNTATNELFTCIDSTRNNNKWKGNKGTTINYIEYPNPGEKGFGVGPAPEELYKKYNLTPLEGCNDPNSDNYGNYKDKSNSIFVFVPKHYIIPKYDANLAKQFPYDGMTYEFSWEPVDNKFTTIHIPRCFINKNNIQDGIFISKYNSNKFQSYYKEDKYTTSDVNKITATSGMVSTYPVLMSGSARAKKWHTVITDSKLFPEIYYMSKTLIPEGTNNNDLGRHNMSIFIQTMLINLGDLHTIASYEKSAREDVCGKLKYLVSGTWVRELMNVNTNGTEKQKYNPVKRIFTGDTTIKNETIHFSSESGSIKHEYNRLFSHNGQYCGVYDVGGPINTPLPGILVVQDDMTAPDTYKVYGLKKTVDITDIEKRTFNVIKDTNTVSVVEQSELFKLTNYDLLATITNNESLVKMLYMDNFNAYSTHLNGVSLLEGTVEQYNSINAGLNIGSLKSTTGNYTEQYNDTIDKAMRVSKFKNSVYNMGFLSKKENMKNDRTKWFGMFTANYVPTVDEAATGGFNINGVYNGYRTRVLRHIGAFKYFKQNTSEYMLGSRTCITPERSHTNSDA
jgi:hypothetical protein